MGKRRRDSERRLKLRSHRLPDDRETLIPCPHCDGSGSVGATEGTRYRIRICPFCRGDAIVDASMVSVIHRWRRIRHWNKVRGKCK